MREGSEIDFTISVFLFCTFEDFPLILVRLSINSKKRYRFCNQRYIDCSVASTQMGASIVVMVCSE